MAWVADDQLWLFDADAVECFERGSEL